MNPQRPEPTIEELQRAIHAFVEEREWGQYHSPRNLAAAISVEAGELLAHFRWLTDEQSRAYVDDPAKREAVAHEIADVLILALELAGTLGIGVGEAVLAKLALNAQRYPVERARGRAEKYSDLPGE